MATQPERAAQRAAIRPVKESIEDELIAKPGVVAVDIAEKETDGKKTGELSIVVFVEEKKPKSKLGKGAAIPTEIDGVKTDVQELVIELQPAYPPGRGLRAVRRPGRLPDPRRWHRHRPTALRLPVSAGRALTGQLRLRRHAGRDGSRPGHRRHDGDDELPRRLRQQHVERRRPPGAALARRRRCAHR